MVTSRVFGVYRRTLKMVPSFKYLGRLILVAYDGWPVVILNLAEERAVCHRMPMILSRLGARPWVSGFF